MLATARWPVNLGKEKDLCCSCERLLVSDTIGAKSEGWGNRDENKERVAGGQQSGGGEWAGHAPGDGPAVGGGNGSQESQLLTDAAATPAKENPDGAEAGEKRGGLHEHFEDLKGWVSGAYYSSEMGMRELGWTADRVFASFQGCEHPEGHH